MGTAKAAFVSFRLGLTDGDAADIAAYIDALPPVDNAIPNECAITP